MKKLVIIAVSALFAVSVTGGVLAHRAASQEGLTEREANNPVLVELFTSQGCSSCPPADRFAARLARERGVIVLSRPVTYWDRLGWKDTLAREENTVLQRLYARRGLAGRNGVYTPQIVVDGQFGLVGSHQAATRLAISRAHRRHAAVIQSRRNTDGSVRVGLGGDAGEGAELMLLAVDASETVGIGRGENAGSTIAYTNVVLDESKLADWSGGSKGVTIPRSRLDNPEADKHVLVLREPRGGRVLAAHAI